MKTWQNKERSILILRIDAFFNMQLAKFFSCRQFCWIVIMLWSKENLQL